jgi:hypothetical protein
MQKLGFDARWIHMLMTCVRMVSYSVLINGQPFGNIIPSRGIRQGDPLSSYFFILCVKVLVLSSTKLKGIEELRGSL